MGRVPSPLALVVALAAGAARGPTRGRRPARSSSPRVLTGCCRRSPRRRYRSAAERLANRWGAVRRLMSASPIIDPHREGLRWSRSRRTPSNDRPCGPTNEDQAHATWRRPARLMVASQGAGRPLQEVPKRLGSGLEEDHEPRATSRAPGNALARPTGSALHVSPSTSACAPSRSRPGRSPR
jgi:hypothetical protein